MKHQISHYKLVGFVTGCVLAATWLLCQPHSLAPPGLLALWLLACTVGEVFWLDAPGEGTISMALVLDIAALSVLDFRGGVQVIALSTLIAGIYPQRRAWYKVLFNAAQSTLAAGAALGFVDLMSTRPELHHLPMTLWWPNLLLVGGTFFAVNTGLVACTISLSTGLPLWRAWRDNFGYPFELASTLAQVTLACFLQSAYEQFGPATLLFLLPLVSVLWYSSTREARTRRALAGQSKVSQDEQFRRSA